MADIANLTRQHKEILELLDKLNAFAAHEIEQNAFTISMLLSQLAGKINIHLSNEDKFVYPKLQETGDAAARQVSSRFAREMGGLAAAFTEFKVRYLSSAKIGADAAGFAAELRQITQAVKVRTAKEEAELYPLLARM